ncbi:MAG: M1 family metallopeptidase [Acidobacteria bacterium]|nr:M1 family metallopeptidase [Acidobacteriota bacterium]
MTSADRPGHVAVRLALPLLLAAGLAAPTLAQRPGAAIDVLDYRFELELSDQTDGIEGKATIAFRILRGVTEVAFDLDDLVEGSSLEADGKAGEDRSAGGMVVSSARVADPAAETPQPGRALRFRQQDDRLLVSLDREAAAGERHRIEVRYGGVPADGFTIGRNRHGERTFFADNWPNRAHHWLPVVDHPSDKATVAFVVTAPARYQAVATGAFVEAVDLGGGMRRTEWRSRAPVATKVMAVGVARFARRRQAEVNGVPVEIWVYPQDREVGLRAFAPAARVLGTFERRLGEYPYAKLGNVQTTTRWGGLENAGNVFYDEDAIHSERGIETLIAHEVAHQWFGDSVTESDWPHVWLSEGFATYLTACYLEWTYGRGRFMGQMDTARERILRYLEQAPDSVIVPEAVPDPRRLLSPNVYQKAAWVLHMLRGEVGDGTFWKGMRTYYQRFRHRNASTADFAAVMEEVSGRKLDWFFDQWLRRPGVPELQIEWEFDAVASTVEVEVRQTGPTIYRLPLEVEAVLVAGRAVRGRVDIEGERTTASLSVTQRPERLRIDPDGWLLLRYTLEAR